MIVDAIEASKKLESAIKRIKNRCKGLDVYNSEYINLIDIKRDLERVELYIDEMKMKELLNRAIEAEQQ